ncbi:MAG: MerR family transcriptional regulator [Acidimicrobiales bacterium]
MNVASDVDPGAILRIGEVALRAGVSPRTLRYYEELGLLTPCGHSPGGARRYSEADVARLVRIRELQDVMGLDLEHIHTMLRAEDRLQELRGEYAAGDEERQREIVNEAILINDRLQAQVRERLAWAEQFLAELESKARRYRDILSGMAPVEVGAGMPRGPHR